MSTALNLHGPRLKIKRAKHHIRHLEFAFNEIVSVNMKRMRGQNKRNRIGASGGVPVREDLAAVLGDAIHNLHAALDHAYCVLVRHSNGIVNNYTKFPFGADEQSLVASINGHKAQSLFSTNLINVILNDIQPYEGGKLGLYELHALDITDKHMTMIPVMSVTSVERLDYIDSKGVSTEAVLSGINLVSRPDQNVTAFRTDKGSFKLHGDPKTTFQVCFERGQPFEGQSILAVLKKLLRSVETALVTLERAASS